MGAAQKTFRHDPYIGQVVERLLYIGAKAERKLEVEPEATFEAVVTAPPRDEDDCGMDGEWGREGSSLNFDGEVEFVRYDPTFRSAMEGAVDDAGCVRLFAGQLPYHMTPHAVAWLVWAVSGRHVVKVEKIVRWRENCRPCGCFHVYCRPEDCDAILLANETCLTDNDGVWVAGNEEQRRYLERFCRALTGQARSLKMPHQLVTLQLARSTYVRPQQMNRFPPRCRAVPWV